MAVAGMRQLLEAGVHFGHQTRRWNPKMREFIFTDRNGIHIIDLQQTVGMLDAACDFVRDVAADGGKVLFVGTKKQAQEAVQEQATRCGMYYVNQRWLGGMLTNFQTMQQRLRHLNVLETMRDSGDLSTLPKREALGIEAEIEKLTRMLGGIKGMRRLPEAIFIVDTKKERLAVMEAIRLTIPIVGVVDTNADPDEVTYPIPANDDAIRAVKLICERIADAIIEGHTMRASAYVDMEGASEEELVDLPLSFAPDENELSYAPPAMPAEEAAPAPAASARRSPAAASAGAAAPESTEDVAPAQADEVAPAPVRAATPGPVEEPAAAPAEEIAPAPVPAAPSAGEAATAASSAEPEPVALAGEVLPQE